MAFSLDSDDPELAAEIARLKGALKARRYRADMDFLLADLDRAIFNQPGWPPPYVVADTLVTEAYRERGVLDPLARIYKDHHWPVSGFIHDFVARATAAGRPDLVEQVWRGVLQQSKRKYLEWLPDLARHGDLPDVVAGAAEAKANALAAFNVLADFYRAQGRDDAAARVAAERAAFDREAFRKTLPPAVADRVDAAAFWRILAEAAGAPDAAEAPSAAEARVRLMEALERLNAAGIGRFQALYAKTMQRLCHWNVWALAYAARGGCGDGAFHDFRAWLIGRGDPALVALAIADPAQAARQVPRDLDLPEGGLDSAIEAAHLARAGKLPKPRATDLDAPKGKEWAEAELAARFPELVRYYADEGGA